MAVNKGGRAWYLALGDMKTSYWITALAGLILLSGCVSNPSVEADAQNLSTLKDSDEDSIEDSLDACSDSPAGVMVDNLGCEVALGAIRGLKFGPNEIDLSADAEAILDRYIETLKRYPNVIVAVEAHTDNRGAAAANLELSKKRVMSVVGYMIRNGLSAGNVKPYAWGENKPLAANATADGRELNRRIEINVLTGIL